MSRWKLVAAIMGLSFSPGRADDTAALKQASSLFPAFRDAVYQDEEKAREIYDSLVEISPLVQKRLLTWLDDEYARKKTAYLEEKTGSNMRPAGNREEKAEIKQLRKELETIRSMDDEEEMKKALETSGWPAMEKLLRLNRSDIRSYSKQPVSDPKPEAVKAALEAAQQIGQFRYDLRKLLGYAITEVGEDLENDEASEQVASIEMDRKAADILKKNEKWKGEISRAEYEGILEVNHWRIAAGMHPLLIDPKLCDAARDHSKDMEEHRFFAHQSPIEGKTTPWDRARNFKTTANGENIAQNQSIAASNMAWFYSPGHHKNLFEPRFHAMGLGNFGSHYTQLFRNDP